MTAKRKIVIGLVVGLIGVVSTITLVSFDNVIVSGFKPRKPKREIPITYNIGWWSNQEILTVESFNVDIVESKLSLLNAETLISYTIKGQLKYDDYWKPHIEQIHLSERIVTRDSIQKIDAEIQITPIVGVTNDKSKKGGIVDFEFKNEHIVNSLHWGTNRIRLTCGTFEKTIELKQWK